MITFYFQLLWGVKRGLSSSSGTKGPFGRAKQVKTRRAIFCRDHSMPPFHREAALRAAVSRPGAVLPGGRQHLRGLQVLPQRRRRLIPLAREVDWSKWAGLRFLLVLLFFVRRRVPVFGDWHFWVPNLRFVFLKVGLSLVLDLLYPNFASPGLVQPFLVGDFGFTLPQLRENHSPNREEQVGGGWVIHGAALECPCVIFIAGADGVEKPLFSSKPASPKSNSFGPSLPIPQQCPLLVPFLFCWEGSPARIDKTEKAVGTNFF